jgi:hypothetical protein
MRPADCAMPDELHRCLVDGRLELQHAWDDERNRGHMVLCKSFRNGASGRARTFICIREDEVRELVRGLRIEFPAAFAAALKEVP